MELGNRENLFSLYGATDLVPKLLLEEIDV